MRIKDTLNLKVHGLHPHLPKSWSLSKNVIKGYLKVSTKQVHNNINVDLKTAFSTELTKSFLVFKSLREKFKPKNASN